MNIRPITFTLLLLLPPLVRGQTEVNISQLPVTTSLATNDLWIVWDTSAPSGSKTRQVNGAVMRSFFSGSGGGSGTLTDVNIVAPDIFTVSESGTTALTITLSPVDQAANKLYYYDNTLNKMSALGIGSGLSISGGNLVSTASGSGTVTSVGITAPSSMFDVGGAVTTAGTLDLTFANVAANTIWAGPASGGAGATVNRSMVAADVPALPASKVTSGVLDAARLGTGTADNTTVLYGDGTWGPITATGDVPSARLISTGAGLAGGGDLSADRTLTLDISNLAEDASPDLSNDYAVFYDASGTVHRKTKISNLTAPTSFPADPDIPAVLGWIETENVRKYMGLGEGLGTDVSLTNLVVKHDLTITNTVDGIGLSPGMNLSFTKFLSRDLTEEWNGNSTAEGKDGNTIVKRDDEAVVYMLVFEDTTPVVGTRLTFRTHKAFTVTGIKLSLATATSSGIFTVDINENGSSIFSTRPTIDQGEKTSTTAAAAEVISDAELAYDSEITIDFDVVGTGGAKPTVTILGR